MRDIYQNAPEVRVWLGEATWSTNHGLEFVPALLQGARRQRDRSDARIVMQLPQSDFRLYYGQFDIPTSEIASHLLALSKMSWFQRGWVIQEVSVAKKVTLICGSYSLEWDDLVKAIGFAVRFCFAISNDIPLQRVVAMDHSRREIANKLDNSLEQLLFRYRDFLSTFSSDKVYALLGLVVGDSTLAHLNVEVDYNESKIDLYRKPVVISLETSCSLDILSACRAITKVDPAQSLPFWVPDWTISDVGLPLMLQGFLKMQYTTTWAVTRNSHYNPEFSKDGKLLCLEGHVLSRITKVGFSVTRGRCGGSAHEAHKQGTSGEFRRLEICNNRAGSLCSGTYSS